MNKKETAASLGITTRTLERHMSAGRITYSMRAGATGKEAFFEPAEVERFGVELNGETISPAVVREAATSPDEQPRQLARLPDAQAAQQFAALLASGVRESMREIVAELVAGDSLPQAPAVWLTIEQAADWLGLPRAAITKALHDDRDGEGNQRRIKALGRGRGLRLHASSVRAYFEG
jgi:hypothetical protein